MKALALIVLFFTFSCFRSTSTNETVQLSSSKQKQKIGWLQKKLEIAERERAKIEAEVEKLNEEIQQAQLALIRKQLDESEKQIHKNPQNYLGLLKDGTLFSQERESLHQLIQEGPSPWAFEAQVELDRILRMITELSETHD